MTQLAVAAAGAAVGSLFGAPRVGWLVGSFIGSQLFAEQQKAEGPCLGDLQVQASTYGMGIPEVFGSMRLAGNVIWARPLIEKRRKQRSRQVRLPDRGQLRVFRHLRRRLYPRPGRCHPPGLGRRQAAGRSRPDRAGDPAPVPLHQPERAARRPRQAGRDHRRGRARDGVPPLRRRRDRRLARARRRPGRPLRLWLRQSRHPGAGEVIGKVVLPRAITLPADLADAAGHVDTPPDELFAIDLTVDAVSIGTITISDAGTFTFATTSHEAKAIAAGAVVRFVAPDPADTSIAGIAVTLVAALA